MTKKQIFIKIGLHLVLIFALSFCALISFKHLGFDYIEEISTVYFWLLSFIILHFFSSSKFYKTLTIIQASVFLVILIKIFYWNTLPSKIEGAYQSKNFGCMCADGLLIFKDGQVSKVNLGHKTSVPYGNYHKEGEHYYLVTKEYGKKKIRPQKAYIRIGDYVKGTRKYFPQKELNRMINYPKKESFSE